MKIRCINLPNYPNFQLASLVALGYCPTFGMATNVLIEPGVYGIYASKGTRIYDGDFYGNAREIIESLPNFHPAGWESDTPRGCVLGVCRVTKCHTKPTIASLRSNHFLRLIGGISLEVEAKYIDVPLPTIEAKTAFPGVVDVEVSASFSLMEALKELGEANG